MVESTGPAPLVFQEYFYEHLTPAQQEKLRQIAENKADPMLLSYRHSLNFGRSVIWALVALATLPIFLFPSFFVLVVFFFIIALAIGSVIAKYVAERFASFWYLHPLFLISSSEDVIRLYPWKQLVSAKGRGKTLTLVFPQAVFEPVCPKKNAEVCVEKALQFAQNPPLAEKDWLALL